MNISNFVVPNGKIINTEDGKKYQKVGLANTTGAVIAANLAGGGTIMAINELNKIPLKKLRTPLTQTDLDTFRQAADKVFTTMNLGEKGVKVVDVTQENIEKIKQTPLRKMPKWLNNFPLLKKLYNKKENRNIQTALQGRNAYYISDSSTILISKKNRPIAMFHEIGHAINHKMGGFSKYLQKARTPMARLAVLALFTALFKRKKAEGEKPKGIFDTTTTFIKNNAGKLVFAGMLPTLLEEGLASIRAAKLGKIVLSPENLKVLNKRNLAGFITYLNLAIGLTLATTVISKVRDAIAAPKEIKE